MIATKLHRACVPLLLAAAASCTNPGGGEQGLLQPQSTGGSCVVKKFFLVRLSSTPTDMSVTANSPCQLTLINPDYQIVNDAALVTARPAHGVAAATLIQQGRSVAVSYAPAAGYTGADRFEVTIQPQARAVMFAVNVQPSVK